MPLPDDVVGLGADVPVCLAPMALRMRGVGEVLDPVPPFPEVWAVLVNPGVPVETPSVFKALAHKSNAPQPEIIPEFADVHALVDWCSAQRNDLQAAAISAAPVIEDVLAALEGSLLARMSGSGATCFGICGTAAAAQDLARKVQSRRTGWWAVPTRLS